MVVALAWCAMRRIRDFGILVTTVAGAGVLLGVMASGAQGAQSAAMPRFGNPDGHFPVPAAGRAVEHQPPQPCHRPRHPSQLHLGGRRPGRRRGRDHQVQLRREAGHDRDARDRQRAQDQASGRPRRRRPGHAQRRWQAPHPVLRHLPGQVVHRRLRQPAVSRRSWSRTSPSRTASTARTRPTAPPTRRSAGTAAWTAAAPSTPRAASSRRSTHGSSATGATATALTSAAAPSACSRSTRTGRSTSPATPSPAAAAPTARR